MSDVATADVKTPATGADQNADKSPPAVNGSANTSADDSLLSDALGGDEKADKPVTVTAKWPDDWRVQMAGGDEKLAKRLERFTDPSKVTASWLSAEQKISSGEFKKQLPENATDEQKAEWRKSNGIPDTPDKYQLPAIEGMEWNDTDKQLAGKFFEQMHAADAPQPVVDAALKAYTQLISEAQVQRSEQDKAFRLENEDKLRAELGNEFRAQINVYQRVLNDTEVLPDGLGPVLAQARDADGNRLINNAAVAKFLINLGLDRYGDGAMISGDAKQTMASEKESLEKLMKTNFAEYVKADGPKKYAAILQREAGRRGSNNDDD